MGMKPLGLATTGAVIIVAVGVLSRLRLNPVLLKRFFLAVNAVLIFLPGTAGGCRAERQ